MKIEKETLDKIKRKSGNTCVMFFTLAGVVLSEPWRQWRMGYAPELVGTDNLLAIIFSIIAGMGAVYGIQEFGGDAIGKHKRLGRRCIMGFIAGAGARMLTG